MPATAAERGPVSGRAGNPRGQALVIQDNLLVQADVLPTLQTNALAGRTPPVRIRWHLAASGCNQHIAPVQRLLLPPLRVGLQIA